MNSEYLFCSRKHKERITICWGYSVRVESARRRFLDNPSRPEPNNKLRLNTARLEAETTQVYSEE